MTEVLNAPVYADVPVPPFQPGPAGTHITIRGLTKYFADNEKVAAALARDYLIMKVNYSDKNHNEEFLSKLPKIPGYPHLYVYDANGKLLHSQGTAELEEGQSYSEEAVLKFLAKWAGEK